MKLCFDDCKYLSVTEKNQSLEMPEDHICRLHGKTIYHQDKHPHLCRLSGCDYYPKRQDMYNILKQLQEFCNVESDSWSGLGTSLIQVLQIGGSSDEFEAALIKEICHMLDTFKYQFRVVISESSYTITHAALERID